MAHGLPIRPLSLSFLDPAQEREYQAAQLERSMGLLRASIVLSILIHGVYFWLDIVILGPGYGDMWAIRLFACIPASAVGLLATFHRDFGRVQQPLIAVLAGVHGVSMVAGQIRYGVDPTMYFTPGLLMAVMYGFVLLTLRFVYASALAVMLVASQIAVIAWQGTPPGIAANAIQVLLISTTIVGAGAYQTELLRRAEYHVGQELIAHERREREVETERSRWLSVIAGFVRHELKNAIAGIGSSLELVSRSPLEPRGQEYVRRATESLQFMRRFLRQVGEASSLDEALRQQETEDVDLSDLVAGRIEDLRQHMSDARFETFVQPGVRVHGNPDSLVQMLDKVLNNAVEHAAPGTAVTVRVSQTGALAHIEVADQGDLLPQDPESLFQPFVTRKSRPDAGNLGLGLYVARVIVAHHGGQIRAESLAGPDGARFVIRLPAKMS